jgi:hypothetical protein
VDKNIVKGGGEDNNDDYDDDYEDEGVDKKKVHIEDSEKNSPLIDAKASRVISPVTSIGEKQRGESRKSGTDDKHSPDPSLSAEVNGKSSKESAYEEPEEEYEEDYEELEKEEVEKEEVAKKIDSEYSDFQDDTDQKLPNPEIQGGNSKKLDHK